jgi:RPA family protein
MDTFQRREVAKRVFAYELSKSTYTTSEGDRTPKYVLTPTGEKCNRVFMVGVLLDKEEVKPDSNFWRIRISDPTGVVTGFVGRYQPEALEALGDIQPPVILSIVAKLNIFEGETSKFLSIRPESINVTDTQTRDYWVIETAKHTVERIKRLMDGADEDTKLAKDVYMTDIGEYLSMVEKAVTVIKEEAEIFSEEGRGDDRTDDIADESAGLKETEEVKTEVGEARTESSEIEDIDLEDFEFEEEEWDLSDILEEE